MMKSRPSGARVACLFNFLSIPSEGGEYEQVDNLVGRFVDDRCFQG